MNNIYISSTPLKSSPLRSSSSAALLLLSFGQQPADKMGRYTAVLVLFFAFGLMSSASMAKPTSRAEAPIAAVPKAAPTESPAASPPVSAPSQVGKTPSSASVPTAQTPASNPTAEGPGPALPPSSGAAATATLEKIMAIIGAALVGGAVFHL